MTVNPYAPPPTDQPTAPTRSVWQRRLRDPILAQLKQGVTPDKIALTLALGVACGLFPFIGLTTLLCFIVAIVFKLNQPIIHVVNQLLWPVHLTAIVFYIRSGEWLYGIRPIRYNPSEIAHLFMHSQRAFWQHFGAISLCAFITWLILMPFIVIGIYYPVRPLLRKVAALRHAKQAKAEQARLDAQFE
jgi:uncharacterized protein (DUF2062 family)